MAAALLAMACGVGGSSTSIGLPVRSDYGITGAVDLTVLSVRTRTDILFPRELDGVFSFFREPSTDSPTRVHVATGSGSRSRRLIFWGQQRLEMHTTRHVRHQPLLHHICSLQICFRFLY